MPFGPWFRPLASAETESGVTLSGAAEARRGPVARTWRLR